MQRIYPSPWTVEEYIATSAHEQIVPESTCPSCRQATLLHRHARYERWLVTLKAQYVLIWVARFLCPLCRKTISYLPDFVATYRAMQWETFQAFIEGQVDRVDVRRFLDRLRAYRRQAERFCTELFRTVGAGLGRAPPRTARGLWGWLKKAGDGLRPVTRKLVTDFKINLFKRYHCHSTGPPVKSRLARSGSREDAPGGHPTQPCYFRRRCAGRSRYTFTGNGYPCDALYPSG